ncbi:MAG: M23 family metallopeptidase [Candidatus Eisenbacteria bacterium]
MSSKQFTLILVHNEGARFRKWRVSLGQLVLGASLLAAGGAGATYSFWSLLTEGADRVELADLERENATLRSTNESFETRLSSLQERLADSEDKTRKLAIVAGLENLGASAEVGIGGTSIPAPLAEVAGGLGVLQESELRSQRLLLTLDRVGSRLDENLRLISATPSITPVRGIFTSSYGYRRDPLSGQRAFHSGVDISAPPGKSVKAAADGVVTRTEQYGGLGRAVHVAHGFGVSTIYGHLSRIMVTPGQKLGRGEILGLVGNSGRATGYHLHYEVQKNGDAVDPMTFMVDRQLFAN